MPSPTQTKESSLFCGRLSLVVYKSTLTLSKSDGKICADVGVISRYALEDYNSYAVTQPVDTFLRTTETRTN